MLADNLELQTEHYGQKWCILGKSGSGKSYTARVVIEEGIKLGVTFTVIDPQAAYDNLQGFYYIDARKVKDAKQLGQLLAGTAKNVVIQTKGMTITEQAKFVKLLLEGYRTVNRKGIRTIVIDEAHKFAPEYDKADSKEEIRAMSQENRSDGLGFIAVEQRSQRLDKTVLSQADHIVLHRLTAKRDLMAVEGYLDNPKEELPVIKKLETGHAYINGFTDEPIVIKVRKADTEHSGSAPKTLLTEDNEGFNTHIRKIYRGRRKMEDISTANEPLNKVVPSIDGFMDLVAAGAKMSLGLGAASFAGMYASRIPSKLPVVSSRTVAGALTTIAVYAGYRNIKHAQVKDVLKYASAGAAVSTAGSLVYDVMAALNVQPPAIVGVAINTMTGVSPVSQGMQADTAGSGDADTNTAFAA